MKYGYKRTTSLAFEKTVSKVKEELSKEGFGILTEIDVKEALKKKLDVEYEDYIIFGACNPPLAYKALQAEKGIGLFLPCNVIVYKENGKTLVATILPTVAMNMIENESLSEIAKEAEEKLKKVIDAV